MQRDLQRATTLFLYSKNKIIYNIGVMSLVLSNCMFLFVAFNYWPLEILPLSVFDLRVISLVIFASPACALVKKSDNGTERTPQMDRLTKVKTKFTRIGGFIKNKIHPHRRVHNNVFGKLRV